MKRLFSPFIFVLLINCLQAQDTVTYQNDIGFNTTFALQGIFNSGQTPFSLMYKRYKADNKAWRLGFDTYININKTDSKTSSSNFNDNSFGYVGLVVGMEYQKPIDKRWTWYYGGDFVPYYSFNSVNGYTNGELQWEEDRKEYGLGFRPFLGIRFNVSERLYLSAEANVLLSYSRTKNYSAFVADPVPVNDTEGTRFVFTASPASGLFLYYRF